jgi:hypothetical protein
MSTHSAAIEATILNIRSKSVATFTRHGRSDVAIAWVEQAIVAGCDPFMRQEPLESAEDAGEWLLVTSKQGASHPAYPGKLADEHFDEVFVVLARLGRILPDAVLKPWHGNVLPDESTPRAIALRVKLAREALAMDRDAFYPACGANPKAGQALEEGNRVFASPNHDMLHDICVHYAISEEWVMCGLADEIEA